MTEKNKDLMGKPNKYFRLNVDLIWAYLRQHQKDLKWLGEELQISSHTVNRLITQQQVPAKELRDKLVSLLECQLMDLLIPHSGRVYA